MSVKKAGMNLGKLTFWLAWPFWFVYFRLNPDRTRVVLIVDGELLLVRTWLGANSWGLPGGGAKRSESLAEAAARELHEETAVRADSSEFSELTSTIHHEHGLRYNARYFLLHRSEKPQTGGRIQEIAEVAWFSKSQLETLDINTDTRFILEHHAEALWYNTKL